jgi:hypothetical protein
MENFQVLTAATSVAEPVERQLFAGAGAEGFWPGSGAGYINFYKMLKP